MGSCSGPLLGHIITEPESSIIDNIFKEIENMLKFYIRYVDNRYVMLTFVNSRIRYHIGQLNSYS